MHTLTTAIVGAGKLGQTHARHWSAMPDVQIVAAADPHPDNARALAERAGTAPAPALFPTLEALLAQIKPDMVDLCTPTHTHRALVEQAARAGCAVFVEKPLARSLQDCNAIVDIVRETGTTLMVGHVVRWFPAYARAREIVQSGAVGAPVTVRASRLAGFPQRSGSGAGWYGNPALSGGVVLDALLHDLDWMRWCFGSVARVYAKGLTFAPEHWGQRDYALVTVRFVSGVVGHATGSWAHSGPMTTAFEICGSSGLVSFDTNDSAPLTLTQGGARTHESPLAASDDPFFCELRAFADAVRAGASPPVTAEDGRAAVQIALAALESMETGQVVTLA